jgi:hypothetical protein
MIFNKEKQRCLFFPPKNGTQTAFNFLQGLGWHSHTNKTFETFHTYPNEMVDKYVNLKNYNLYCFLRNPIDRFVSAVLWVKRNNTAQIEHVLKTKNVDSDAESLTYDQFVDNLEELKLGTTPKIFEPQINWLAYPGINILNFYNYEAELRQLSGAYDRKKYPIRLVNVSTDFGKSVVTSKVIEFVKTNYFEDCKLWDTYFSKSVAA